MNCKAQPIQNCPTNKTITNKKRLANYIWIRERASSVSCGRSGLNEQLTFDSLVSYRFI